MNVGKAIINFLICVRSHLMGRHVMRIAHIGNVIFKVACVSLIVPTLSFALCDMDLCVFDVLTQLVHRSTMIPAKSILFRDVCNAVTGMDL